MFMPANVRTHFSHTRLNHRVFVDFINNRNFLLFVFFSSIRPETTRTGDHYNIAVAVIITLLRYDVQSGAHGSVKKKKTKKK